MIKSKIVLFVVSLKTLFLKIRYICVHTESIKNFVNAKQKKALLLV